MRRRGVVPPVAGFPSSSRGWSNPVNPIVSLPSRQHVLGSGPCSGFCWQPVLHGMVISRRVSSGTSISEMASMSFGTRVSIGMRVSVPVASMSVGTRVSVGTGVSIGTGGASIGTALVSVGTSKELSVGTTFGEIPSDEGVFGKPALGSRSLSASAVSASSALPTSQSSLVVWALEPYARMSRVGNMKCRTADVEVLPCPPSSNGRDCTRHSVFSNNNNLRLRSFSTGSGNGVCNCQVCRQRFGRLGAPLAMNSFIAGRNFCKSSVANSSLISVAATCPSSQVHVGLLQ
jgi:hypothetical protein